MALGEVFYLGLTLTPWEANPLGEHDMASDLIALNNEFKSYQQRMVKYGLFAIGLCTGLVSGFVGLLLSA